MLNLIAEKLMAKGLVGQGWLEEMTQRGERVKLFRDYYDGDHRMKLTNEMKRMMQIDSSMDRYNVNYCEMVVAAMADRLTAEGIDTSPTSPPGPLATSGEGEQPGSSAVGGNGAVVQGEDAGQAWIDRVMAANRFDALQIDVREAALRDGETFVMVAYDERTGLPQLAHEPAWDGVTGTMVVYDRQMKVILAGVKVWHEGNKRRANIYYPTSMEKYELEQVETDNGMGIKSVEERLKFYGSEAQPIDTTRDGQVSGVPLVHFPNRGKRKAKSELLNVVPLQDSLNSTLVSMVMTALLTAFPHLFAKGWEPPAGVTPGMIFSASVTDENGQALVPETEEHARAIAAILSQYDLKRIEPGDIGQLTKAADWLIDQIATISSTPVPGQMGGDSSSGEALKVRGERLTGKVLRAQVQFGNSWEDVFYLGHRQATLFGVQRPPAIGVLSTRWKSAEIRNTTDLLRLVEIYFKYGLRREALRVVSQTNIVQYSEDEIDAVIEQGTGDESRALTGLALPGFDTLAV